MMSPAANQLRAHTPTDSASGCVCPSVEAAHLQTAAAIRAQDGMQCVRGWAKGGAELSLSQRRQAAADEQQKQ